MNNIDTEKSGILWLINKLSNEGWIVNRVHKVGCDLYATRENEERFIEVKTTEKDDFGLRWLEEKEMQLLTDKKDKFYVYLITKASSAPALHVLPYEDLVQRMRKKSIMQWFDFRLNNTKKQNRKAQNDE